VGRVQFTTFGMSALPPQSHTFRCLLGR
jgi:hypothetical protein